MLTSMSRLLGGCRRRGTPGNNSRTQENSGTAAGISEGQGGQQLFGPRSTDLMVLQRVPVSDLVEIPYNFMDTYEEPESQATAMNSEEEEDEEDEKYGGQATGGFGCAANQDLCWSLPHFCKLSI